VKVHFSDEPTLGGVLRALCKMPEDARRFALVRVSFAIVGERGCAGMALGPRHLGGDRWLVALGERGALVESTVAHEVAHALFGHQHGSAEHEREAAAMAASWGFAGASADPAMCVERFERAESKVATRRRVDGRVPLRCNVPHSRADRARHCGRGGRRMSALWMGQAREACRIP
jgi:hypothetical protein